MKVVSEELAPYIDDGKIEVEYTALSQFRQVLEDLLKEIDGHFAAVQAPRRGRPPGSKNGTSTRKKRATAKKKTGTARRKRSAIGTVGTVRRRSTRRRTTRRRRTPVGA